jgi:hypothetical protein
MGIPVRLVVANSMRPYPDQVPGDWMFDLDLPRADENPGGEAQFQMNIESCSGVPVSIGDQVTTNFNHPRVGQTAVDALIAQDPGAYWDGTHIAGSVAPVSPRLVAIGVFDPTEYAAVSHAEPGFPVRIRNIIGLFLERMEGRTAVHGRLVPLAGAFDASADQVTDDSSFLRAITMVR